MIISPVRRRALRALIPPPKLKLSEWIEANIRLPTGLTAHPGPMRLWPFQRAIADSIGDVAVERVSVLKSARVGYSSLITSVCGYFVANDPAPILLIQPTSDDCRDYAVNELDPLFESSPILEGLLTNDTDEAERSVLLSRKFRGGSLKIVAARSPRALRRHTTRVLLCDEVDGWEVTAEGDPLKLAERRTVSFDNRKIVVGSTPVFESTSTILREYAQSDMRIYECPCPQCSSFTEVEWECIEWLPDQPETAAWRCPHCSELVSERHKTAMVNAGRWRATRPEVKDHHGYRLSALISPLHNARWSKLVAEYLAAKDDPAELQTFWNTCLGRGWAEAGDTIDADSLQARAEPFSLEAIPEQVIIVTAGVDVQDDRCEATICGWSRDNVCFVLDHLVMYGSPLDPHLWALLDELLRSTWKHPKGGTLKVDAAAIDAGDGGHFAKCLEFCGPRAGRRVMAIKGVPGFTRKALEPSKAKMKIASRLWLAGVDSVKLQIFNKLARGQSIRFSNGLESHYFEQLSSERLVTRMARGKPVRRFERIPGRRSESLDALAYAMAAKSVAQVQIDHREAELAKTVLPTPRPAVIKSQWMERQRQRW